MRIAFLIATLALGLKLNVAAYATINQLQEQKAEQFCQVNPTYCK